MVGEEGDETQEPTEEAAVVEGDGEEDAPQAVEAAKREAMRQRKQQLQERRKKKREQEERARKKAEEKNQKKVLVLPCHGPPRTRPRLACRLPLSISPPPLPKQPCYWHDLAAVGVIRGSFSRLR